MKLSIKKFKTIENLTIENPATISGGNGVGKSTILEALSFCLTGKDLQGNEFKQIYDNRVDLHDAVANVSFFDTYGNEFQRVVTPTWQTNRVGIEELKIKCSTKCLKNGIEVNNYADEFSDFLKFGTDYFFNQKEDVQRSIFIDILKSKLPDYDVNSASLKLKEFKKAQKNSVEDVKSKNEQLKAVKDVEVSTIDPEILQLNNEFLKLSEVDNSKVVSEINKRNNEIAENYQNKKRAISNECLSIESNLLTAKPFLFTLTGTIKIADASELILNSEIDTKDLVSKISLLNENLKKLEYFENIGKYAEKHFIKNSVLVENQNKIIELNNLNFIAAEKINGACPLTGEMCESAKLHSVAADKLLFENEKKDKISDLKQTNRQILSKEMNDANSNYLIAKSELERAKNELQSINQKNERIINDNTVLSATFEQKKSAEKSKLNAEKLELEIKINDLTKQLTDKQNELSALVEPTFDKLPENLEISEDLKAAQESFELLNKQLIGQTAINKNNFELRKQYESEIKTLQANLFTICEQISVLQTEISNYFSNLQGVVKSEFDGDIKIDVELLEYVISKDEYKDCFKITADGKIFPYECNGALQNNLKLQVLGTFQRLKDYKGITIMDNCEANTTDGIRTNGMNCILAFATNDKDLTIK